MTRLPKLEFVHIVTNATRSASHGIAALAAQLNGAGWQADELGVSVITDDNFVTDASLVLSATPDIILFSVMSNQWPRACALANAIRVLDPKPIIGIGGVHVASDPSSVTTVRCFDFAVSGEADLQIAEWLKNSDGLRDVNRSSPIVLTASAPEALDLILRPNLRIFSTDLIRDYPGVIFSRGCPYHCTYCNSRNGGLTGRVRWKSPDRAIDEVRDLLEYATPSYLLIDDDTLLKNPRWLRAFCTLYAREFEIPFYCNARPETITAELVELLAKSHCEAIGIGIESGSYRLRAEVLGRPMTDERIRNAFSVARAAGLKTWSFNMVGIPGETYEDVQALVELNQRCSPDYVRLSVYTAYPGTPLGDSYSSHTHNAHSYFQPWDQLPQKRRRLVRKWLARLKSEDRLWYTNSELEAIVASLGDSGA